MTEAIGEWLIGLFGTDALPIVGACILGAVGLIVLGALYPLATILAERLRDRSK